MLTQFHPLICLCWIPSVLLAWTSALAVEPTVPAKPQVHEQPQVPAKDTARAELSVRELAHFAASEAHQGVAVDDKHFYAVTNRAVGKYELATGKKLAEWKSSEQIPLTHLNSGVVHEGRLYAAHSNWPQLPRRSSIEIWDTQTLEHIGSQPFENEAGALNWVDRSGDHWFGVFAQYRHGSDVTAQDHVSQTKLVQFTEDWEIAQAWTFPAEVWRRFAPSSNSGGCFSPDGTLYCTGHDHAELYHLRIPQTGSVLEYLGTLAAPIAGQGIAIQRLSTAKQQANTAKQQANTAKQQANTAKQRETPLQLFGIRRARREVVQMELLVE